MWQIWEASSFAGCTLPATPGGPAWRMKTGVGFNGLETYAAGAVVRFPVPYLEGTILEAAKVKWAGVDGEGTLIVRVIKRDESSPASTETMLAEEEENCPAEYAVIEADLSSTVIVEDFSYWVEVESNLTTDSPQIIWMVGIQTSKRIL